jgi:hypothetical protein
LLSNQSFAEQLEGLSQFLQSHPKEIIILNLNQIFLSKNDPDLESSRLGLLYQYLENEFSQYIASYNEFSPTSKISEFGSKNKNLIIIASSNNLPKWVWPSYDTYYSIWDSGIYSQDYHNILDFVEQQLNNRDYNKFFVAQLQFTPDASFIINNVIGNNGLKKVSYSNLDERYRWMETRNDINIYIIDYTLGYDGVGYAIMKNKIQ